MPIAFPPQAEAEFRQILARYPTKQAALLPALHLAQREFGWISPEAMAYVAGLLTLPPIKVYEVVTFYGMYHQQPVGRHLVACCATLSCALNGAEALLRHLEGRLGIKAGETTPDGRVTLKKVECLAACDAGPCLQVNGAYRDRMDAGKADRLLAELT